MTERRREVVTEYHTYYVCDVHGWDYTDIDDDVCPVCLGELNERERILKWVEENRSAIEIEPGENIYRDHFNSQSLIAFINGENE
jgi:hypothetical protein